MLLVAFDRSVFLAMIIKEYRVVMPLSVEEYQVAQLYMVAKLSTQQTGVLVSLELGHLLAQHFSHCLTYTSAAPSFLRTFAGGGEGVTVLVNEPFANHPELGSGQVIIHLFQHILPKFAYLHCTVHKKDLSHSLQASRLAQGSAAHQGHRIARRGLECVSFSMHYPSLAR